MNKIFQWFVWSSKDPNNVSLSAQSLLLGYIPIVLTLAGFIPSLHDVVTVDSLTALVHSIAEILNAVLIAISAIGFIYGFARKLYVTVAAFFK